MGTMQRRRRCIKELAGDAPPSRVLARWLLVMSWFRGLGVIAVQIALAKHQSNRKSDCALEIDMPRQPISPNRFSEIKRIINQDAADRGYKLEWSE